MVNDESFIRFKYLLINKPLALEAKVQRNKIQKLNGMFGKNGINVTNLCVDYCYWWDELNEKRKLRENGK